MDAFESGQSHALHAHHGMDKFYHVLEGQGVFLLEGRELPMGAGDMLIAPEGLPTACETAGPGVCSSWRCSPPRRKVAGRDRTPRDRAAN